MNLLMSVDTKKKEKNNHNYSLLGEYFCSMLCLILEMEIKICWGLICNKTWKNA